jgi:hypothetical protein
VNNLPIGTPRKGYKACDRTCCRSAMISMLPRFAADDEDDDDDANDDDDDAGGDEDDGNSPSAIVDDW